MATTKQIVVPLENKPGTLAEVTRDLAQANVNILGVSLGIVGDFGIARFLVSDPAKAEQTLRSKGIKFRTTDVITVKVPNKVGALAEVTEKLARSSINVESVFVTTSGTGEAEIAIQPTGDVAQAQKVLGA